MDAHQGWVLQVAIADEDAELNAMGIIICSTKALLWTEDGLQVSGSEALLWTEFGIGGGWVCQGCEA